MRFAHQLAAASALLSTTSLAMAHDGHGLPGTTHWHATDATGFVVVALLAALAIWLSRGE